MPQGKQGEQSEDQTDEGHHSDIKGHIVFFEAVLGEERARGLIEGVRVLPQEQACFKQHKSFHEIARETDIPEYAQNTEGLLHDT